MTNKVTVTDIFTNPMINIDVDENELKDWYDNLFLFYIACCKPI